jgi:hypothetical protein
MGETSNAILGPPTMILQSPDQGGNPTDQCPAEEKVDEEDPEQIVRVTVPGHERGQEVKDKDHDRDEDDEEERKSEQSSHQRSIAQDGRCGYEISVPPQQT